MIYSFVHPGSGLGNQLFRVVAGKVLSLDKGYEYSAIGKDFFKGKTFMNLDMGKDNDLPIGVEYPAGKIVMGAECETPLWEEKTSYYSPEFNFTEDNTIIDGEFQDERYFGHRMVEIEGWLKVEHIEIPDDLCIIGFRGGEFYVFPELGLPKEYFDKGIKMMKEINPNMRFEVHTDDPELAKQFFPDYKIIHDIGINWRSMRYAKHAIIANSSFYILPRLLSHHNEVVPGIMWNYAITIAPRYWARRNTKTWVLPQNYYKDFIYV
jgi:hypothetical protein